MTNYIYKPWTPTPEEFKKYQEREVEMAKKNLLNNHAKNTLHSDVTLRLLLRPRKHDD